MAINIFDDEVLKKNKSFISNEIKEETLIEKSADANKTEFGILYDYEGFEENETRKAFEDPRRSVEIGLASAEIRTPTQVPSDPRTNEITFEGFSKAEGGKWNELNSPNTGITKDNINIDLASRESLENSFSVSDSIEESENTKNIILEGFERLESGKWRRLSFPNESSINKDLTDTENKNPNEVYFSSSEDIPLEARNSSILKLQDEQGNLIDPDNALEEEEYTPVLIGRGDKREILSEFGEDLTNFKYNQIYENDFWKEDNWLGEGRASRPGKPVGEETVNASDLEIREKTSGGFLGIPEYRERELSIFLFMLFPYIGTSTVLNIRNAITGPDVVGLATSASQNAYFLMQNMRYYTPFELAKYFLHNFYTMHFMKEMTIKYAPGRAPTGAPNAKQWDGRPDIFHGKENSALFYLKQLHNIGDLFRKPREDLGDGSQFLTQHKDGVGDGSSSSVLPDSEVLPLSPDINISSFGQAFTRLVDEPGSVFTESKQVQRDRHGDRTHVARIPDIKVVNNKWVISDNLDESKIFRISSILRDKTLETTQKDDFYINKDVLKSKGYIPTKGENGKWNAIPDAISSEQAQEIEKIFKEGGIREKIYGADLIEDTTLESSNNTLNKDVLNINLAEFKYLGEAPQGSETVKDAIRRRDLERNDINSLQVGSILVAPVVDDDFRDESVLPRFHIPFEFNPDISEGGVEAQYEAISVLSRIGEMRSFSGTGAYTITLETEYKATAHAEQNDVGTDGNNWMSFYTLEKIQAIEKAYRSLVLPHFPDDTSIEQGYAYIKPPLLRVIIGGANDAPGEEGPYANILTYGRNSMVDGRLDSSETVFGSSHARLKSFIATNVTITKDLSESPIILDKKGRIKDTIGFKVSLGLTEVTANYMDSIPDFKRYSDVYRKAMPSFIKT